MLWAVVPLTHPASVSGVWFPVCRRAPWSSVTGRSSTWIREARQ